LNGCIIYLIFQSIWIVLWLPALLLTLAAGCIFP